MWLSEMQKFGAAFTGFGAIFFLLGIFTFFDSALLALGNLLFIIGIILLIGPSKTLAFFTRKQKLRGTIAFLVGIVLILSKHAFIGFIVESVGILQLFGDFFAVVVAFLRSMPIIGPILSGPVVGPIIDKLAGVRVLPL